jgi:predicted AlkP superfamily pyrophosphatase or phosphodiesterase
VGNGLIRAKNREEEMTKRNVIVLDVVGLRPEYLQAKEKTPHLNRLMDKGYLRMVTPVFPAVTLPVQATLTTGLYPAEHGVIANGFYSRETFDVGFWEQAASLVQGERIWTRLRKKDDSLKTALLFFQNSLYADCDAVITPKPLHTEEGMIQWCYSKPVNLYEEICNRIGEFNLMHFWGPLAGIESSRWIGRAAVEVMALIHPDLMFVYLPHLDYCSQKFGPDDPQTWKEAALVDAEVGNIIQGIEAMELPGETIFVVLSEYAFSRVQGDIPLNRILREKGFFAVRTIKGREYPDLELSTAFAMVDHQIAHIYVKPGYENGVKTLLDETEGIDIVLDAKARSQYRIDNPRAGDLVAVSARDRWFSYYWWEDRAVEPDFATHVDIHRKPGYDPLELFLEPGTMKVSQDTGLIRGSHGRPPLSDADLVPLIVSGESGEQIEEDGPLAMNRIPELIERILLS